LGLLAVTAALAFQAAPQATIVEQTHYSQVMAGNRAYRVFLPPAYAGSQTRYPVIYWIHGFEQSSEVDAYSQDIAAYVATHDVLVVDFGPLETTGEFPLYFPELAGQIDKQFRTIADRGHRAVSGYSAGGFLALFTGGKFPDWVSSASDFMGPTEYALGPSHFDVETNEDELYENYGGVRTRLVTGTRDFIRFYHRRLNSIWLFARSNHETEEFDSAHGVPGLAKTFDFHMHSFAGPLPKPAIFSHIDMYPNFAIWDWEVASDRRQPGFTLLENVSATGFRCAVREWLPSGDAIPGVNLSIASARLYAPGSPHSVTYVRLRDGKLKKTALKADAQGRLNFELDGDAYEVGISSEPLIAVSGYEIADAAWATAGQPVKLRVKFLNKGPLRSATAAIQWTSPNPGVTIDVPASRLFALMPGETVALPVTVTVSDPARAVLELVAVNGTHRMPVDVPLFPPAEPVKNFQIADGRTVTIAQHATQTVETTLGQGNGDGYAAPGESFAILIPDGGTLRAAELFTNDACVDNSVRASDSWVDYDHTGASVKYSMPAIKRECEPGHVVHMLARVVIPHAPGHQVRYAAIEFPVWWRNR
jgi:hypothetical protein